MIFYFSGTGNSRWAAQKIAALTNDEAFDIIQCTDVPDVTHETQIGLVFPIYAWGAPEPVLTFVKKIHRKTQFTFGVCTCGEEAGLAMKKFSRFFPLDSSYSLVMPNNYIIGADVDDEETARQKITAAKHAIEQLSREILQQKRTYHVHEGRFASLKSGLVHFGFEHFARSTKPFYVTDACNGCGLCAAHCPANTISMAQKKPVWAQRCFQCLRCINECPQAAIQYTKATERRSRYTFPHEKP
ncbi:MAG TPA: EFR1 family ferrodoxin [Candidatus Ruthenibacterium merdavium]|uniref:Ferredoxin n=1 Tax=Candidatus Ruthenibacterium merdavium TaxID=2838752 RepID=A0A9D2TL77_9FIRM|nr:EFR1 family ferrodoxin [Candidatus Ruthenibacterium merdavium]